MLQLVSEVGVSPPGEILTIQPLAARLSSEMASSVYVTIKEDDGEFASSGLKA